MDEQFKDDLTPPAQTVRKNAGGNEPLYLDRFGKPTTTPPTKIVEPEQKPTTLAPKPYDPHAKYPDPGGHTVGTFRVSGGKVQDLGTGQYLEPGQTEYTLSSFSTLVPGMSSKR